MIPRSRIKITVITQMAVAGEYKWGCQKLYKSNMLRTHGIENYIIYHSYGQVI